MLTQTSDLYIFIEEVKPGYTRYRQLDDEGKLVRRWEVHGTCDRRGDCLIGAVIDTPDGSIQIMDQDHLNELKEVLGKERIDYELDVPVSPEFNTCCGVDRFSYVELKIN